MPRLNTRAFQLQFHWIFVMIAGAVIIAFFFSLAMEARRGSQMTVAVEVANAMAATFTGALQSADALNNQTMPRQGIAFACSSTCECNFVIDPDGVAKSTPFNGKIIFAPPSLSRGELWLWTLPWRLPMRATNIVLAMNRGYHVILVHDDADPASRRLFFGINKSLPAALGAVSISPSEIESVRDAGYQHYRFVFVGVDPEGYAPPNSLRNAHGVSALKIDDTSAAFYAADGGAWVMEDLIPYPTEHYASMFAAMFSVDPQLYHCGMLRAFRKLALVSRVQEQRTRAMAASPVLQENGCAYLADWGSLADIAGRLGSYDAVFVEQDYLALDQAVSGIEAENERLLDIGPTRCPPMY